MPHIFDPVIDWTCGNVVRGLEANCRSFIGLIVQSLCSLLILIDRAGYLVDPICQKQKWGWSVEHSQQTPNREKNLENMHGY